VRDVSQVGDDVGDGGQGRARTFERAALAAAGEHGYRNLTVQKILDRAELNRSLFYRLYSDKSDCYASAYSREISQLTERILNASCGEVDWAAGLRAALDVIAGYLASDRLVARGLLLEVHVARGAGFNERLAVFERLADALDTARQAAGSDVAPPPLTAAFLLNTVEAAAARSLLEGEPKTFADAIPTLVFIAVSLYFGPDVAEARSGS
jgi:AcrR family transcriptional regulator